MPEIIESLPVTLSTLSPLHIGMGERLGGLDFVWEGRSISVVDQKKLAARLAANQGLADAYIRLCETDHPRIGDFLREHHVPPRDLAAYSLPAKGHMAAAVIPFIKGANGRPFVPGSSVKGAIRSALLRSAVMQDETLRDAVANAADTESRRVERRVRPGRPAKMSHSSGVVDHGCFGPDQQHDVMRVLGFADSRTLEFSDFMIADVRVLSVRGTSLGIKQTPRSREMVLPCEVVAPGSTVRLRLTRLDHLLTDEKAVKELGFSTKAELIHRWTTRCNQVALWAAEHELEFYHCYGESRLARWYEETLLPVIRGARENECVLHFAWGAGFEAMTVTNLLPVEQSRMIRTRLALGKGEPFPKSRKVVFQDDEPWMPLGWVLLPCGEGQGRVREASSVGGRLGEMWDIIGLREVQPKVGMESIKKLQERLGRQTPEDRPSSKKAKGSERAKAEQERIRRKISGEDEMK